jgi:predicted O-methyltransferase YrrM
MRFRRRSIALPLACLSLVAADAAPGRGGSAVPRASQAQAAASRTIDPGISVELTRLLEEIRDKDSGQLAVSEEDGRFLRTLVAASGARRALEIGGASGYSAIWIALGLRETGGRLVTIEYDPERARALSANIERAGFGAVVQVVAGDAFAQIPKLPGTFDFVFLDAWKRDYKRFLDLVSPRLDPGGLFVAHNVVNKRSEMGDFLDAIRRQPSLLTAFASPSGEGMSISYKRKP